MMGFISNWPPGSIWLFILTDGNIDGVLFNQRGDGNFVMS